MSDTDDTLPPPPGPGDLVRRILAGESIELDPRQRMTLERVAMPEADADQRSHSFEEVNLGLTEHLAALEAERCLQCKNPKCIDGCPVRVNIPRFIESELNDF